MPGSLLVLGASWRLEKTMEKIKKKAKPCQNRQNNFWMGFKIMKNEPKSIQNPLKIVSMFMLVFGGVFEGFWAASTLHVWIHFAKKHRSENR